MIINHLTISWRNVLRNKAFSLINITGLSIGITCALVIVIFVRYELSFDAYHKRANQVYKIVQETKFAEDTEYWATTAYPLAEAIRNDFSQIPYVTQASGPVSRTFRIEDKNGNVSRYEEPSVLYVDPYYLQVFDFNWIQGDPATALSQPNSVVLTINLAKKYFDNEFLQQSVLGRQIFLNNKDALTVTGIVEDAPATSSLKYSMLIPYEFFRVNNPYPSGNWSGNYQGSTFVVLKEGDSPKKLEEQLATWKKKYLKPEDDNRILYRLRPLVASHTDEKFGSAPRSYTMPKKIIYASIGIGVFVLLMACVNFINLATAQSAARAREVGVRKVLGSSRLSLIKQYLIENSLIVGLAVFVSLALTQVGLRAINQQLSIIHLHLALEWTSVAIVLVAGGCVILLACLYPAVVMASYRPVEALKNKLSSPSGLSLRRSLIVLQFSIVQLFVIGTLIVAAQMHFVRNEDMGFSKEDPIIITNLNELDRREAFRQKLLRNPAIKDISFASSSPVSDYGHHFGTSFRLPGQREEQGIGAEEKGVDLNFLSFYKLELLAGRNFAAIEDNFNEFIVNEKLIHALGWTPEEAIGQKLIINEGEATIVGVVKDFHNNSFNDEISPCVFLNAGNWLEQSNIKLYSEQGLPETLTFIETSWKEIYPDGVYKSSFLDDDLAKKYALEDLVLKGFTTFSMLTIVIGCLGLYGLLSFVTRRKTKEVSIRKVLGASTRQILALFGNEFIILILVAFFFSAPFCYYWMDRWLSSFAYHIDLSWWMFVLGVLLTFAITMMTISYHSIKAAYANPVESLRNE